MFAWVLLFRFSMELAEIFTDSRQRYAIMVYGNRNTIGAVAPGLFRVPLGHPTGAELPVV